MAHLIVLQGGFCSPNCAGEGERFPSLAAVFKVGFYDPLKFSCCAFVQDTLLPNKPPPFKTLGPTLGRRKRTARGTSKERHLFQSQGGQHSHSQTPPLSGALLELLLFTSELPPASTSACTDQGDLSFPRAPCFSSSRLRSAVGAREDGPPVGQQRSCRRIRSPATRLLQGGTMSSPVVGATCQQNSCSAACHVPASSCIRPIAALVRYRAGFLQRWSRRLEMASSWLFGYRWQLVVEAPKIRFLVG
jgi:hypothetical protein